MVTMEGLVAENLKVVDAEEGEEEEHVDDGELEILMHGNGDASDIFSLSTFSH